MKDHCSLRSIAREIGRSPSTIHYEIKRGTVKLYHGNIKRYKAQQGQSVYQNQRQHCGRKSDFLKKHKFIDYVQRHFFEDDWSLDVCSNRCTAVGEFADLSQLEDISKTLVYYAHPYTSCDKGTVERHNGLIRRFIPKGDYIHNYSLQQIINIETWCNSLPRKILAYHTPDEIFERELDQIYQTA